MGATALMLGLVLAAGTPVPGDPPAPLRAVEAPTAREIGRCFRGLTGPRLSFSMDCELDAQGRPRQCEAAGLSEPQNHWIRSRVNCIGEQFRFEAVDGSPVRGRRIHVPLTYSPAR